MKEKNESDRDRRLRRGGRRPDAAQRAGAVHVHGPALCHAAHPCRARQAGPDAPAPGLRQCRRRNLRRADAGRPDEFAGAAIHTGAGACGRVPLRDRLGGQLHPAAADAVARADAGRWRKPPDPGRRHPQPGRAALPFPGAQLCAAAAQAGRALRTAAAPAGLLSGRWRRDGRDDHAGSQWACAFRYHRTRRPRGQPCRMLCARAATRGGPARTGPSGPGPGLVWRAAAGGCRAPERGAGQRAAGHAGL